MKIFNELNNKIDNFIDTKPELFVVSVVVIGLLFLYYLI